MTGLVGGEGMQSSGKGENELNKVDWRVKERGGSVGGGVVHKKKEGKVTEKTGVRGGGRGEQEGGRGRATTRAEGAGASEREEGLFVDHWQIMGSLGQT